METLIDSLTFKYQNGEISSVRVAFGTEEEDSILINSKYITELRNYLDISEEDKELFFIIARAIQLRKENNRSSRDSVEKYNLGSKYEPFHETFISKLIEVSKQVPFEVIALYFDDDSKLEDLDIFLNQKTAYELALLMMDGLPIDISEEDFNNWLPKGGLLGIFWHREFL